MKTNGPVAHTPSTKVPMEKTPRENRPAEKIPTENSPAEDTPAEKTPADSTPRLNTPADSQPDVVPKASLATGAMNTPIANKTIRGTQMIRWMIVGRVMAGSLVRTWNSARDV